MSKIILPDSTEIAIATIYTSGQGRISFYPTDSSIDVLQFADVTGFTVIDDDENQTEYSDLVFVEAQNIAAEQTDVESEIESEESNILTLKITYRVMTAAEKRLKALETSQTEQDTAIVELASLLA